MKVNYQQCDCPFHQGNHEVCIFKKCSDCLKEQPKRTHEETLAIVKKVEERAKPLDRLLDTKKLSDSKPECTCSDNGMTKTVRSDCPIHQAMLQINAVQDPKPKPDETIVIRGKATLDGIGTFDNSKPECECCTCHKDKICYHPCCRNKPECTCHINHYGKIGIGIENVPSCPVHGIEPKEDWEKTIDRMFERGKTLSADKIKAVFRELLQKERESWEKERCIHGNCYHVVCLNCTVGLSNIEADKEANG